MSTATRSWTADLDFERVSPARGAVHKALLDPLANYLPARLLRGALRLGHSELAEATWHEPGGWRSMVMSYDGRPRHLADKLLVGSGSLAAALRNRRRMAIWVLSGLIDTMPTDSAEILSLGAGAGHNTLGAMVAVRRRARATLVDRSAKALECGARAAWELRLSDRVRFIQGDVRDVRGMLDPAPSIVAMLGICEYLGDDDIVAIAETIADRCEDGCTIVVNSLSDRHGTDRFLRRVLGLRMVYRSPLEMEALLRRAGFMGFVSIAEPLGVYHLLAGRWLGSQASQRARPERAVLAATGA